MKNKIFIILAVLIGLGGYTFYSNFLKESSLSFDLHGVSKRAANFDRWVTFKPKGEHYSASFPLKPTKSSREIPIPGGNSTLKYHEYLCTTAEARLFSVSYTTLPDSFLK
nr:hypothetical protein [Chlamydiota bacterium]